MSDELEWMAGHELAARIKDREISPVDAVDAVLARLEVTEPQLNAFVTVLAEEARATARHQESLLMRESADSLPPLFGVPITVKDLCETAGVRTTYGSRAFSDNVPEHDAVTWSRLKAAGANLIGKTTTPEFGGLGITVSGLTGTTNNPWDVSRTPGGSSGGAAASVAAGVAPFAWGSDGGGSVRIPAACCGVVGLKASRGRIPVEHAWDTVGTDGPLTRTVLDTALLLSVTAGPDPRDPLSLPRPTDDFVLAAARGLNPKALRIAFAPAPAGAEIDVEVARVVQSAMHDWEAAGSRVEIVELDLPDPVQYFEDFWSPSFALHFGGSADGVDVTDNPTTLEFARIGSEMTAAQYEAVMRTTRALISEGYRRVFEEFDLLVTPTMPVTAFPHPGAEAGPLTINGRAVKRPAIDFHRLTESPSHAGLPAITVPCGFSDEGLPVGLQIIGPHFADALILAAASTFESMRPWSMSRPALG